MPEVKLFQMGEHNRCGLSEAAAPSLPAPLNSFLASLGRSPADVSAESSRTAVTAEATTTSPLILPLSKTHPKQKTESRRLKKKIPLPNYKNVLSVLVPTSLPFCYVTGRNVVDLIFRERERT